jgi:predicted nucleic acid-binding protein
MSSLIIDTGPLVALLDRRERNHRRCIDFFSGFRGKLITTEQVLTEAMYLLGPSFQSQKPALEFFLQGGAELISLSPELLKRSLWLMNKYADIPMDFADATLVALAEQLRVTNIFTLDRRGFETYRINGKKTFDIYPG